MAAIVKSVTTSQSASGSSNDPSNADFLKYLPAVRTHAGITFRDLPAADREDAVAEAVAASYCNYLSLSRRGRKHVITPATLARYGVLHARAGRHIGGGQDSQRDVLSWRAQRAGGFEVMSLSRGNGYRFDCLRVPDQPVWRLTLLHDRRTPIPDQVAFRQDWSTFMAQQTDRTRQAIALLAEGDQRCEVADKLGVTAPAITQRMNRARREWEALQSDSPRTARADRQALPPDEAR